MVEDSDRFTVICAATLHDDLLRQVRMWARQGFPASHIQAELDARFAHVFEFQLAEKAVEAEAEAEAGKQAAAEERESGYVSGQ